MKNSQSGSQNDSRKTLCSAQICIHVTTANDVSDWASNFYLYLLAKNGMAAQARPGIAKLENLGRPGIDRFLDWYATRFELNNAENLELPTLGAQQVTEAVDLY